MYVIKDSELRKNNEGYSSTHIKSSIVVHCVEEVRDVTSFMRCTGRKIVLASYFGTASDKEFMNILYECILVFRFFTTTHSSHRVSLCNRYPLCFEIRTQFELFIGVMEQARLAGLGYLIYLVHPIIVTRTMVIIRHKLQLVVLQLVYANCRSIQ